VPGALALAALALAGCGGGTRQDAKEASGTFTVDVPQASFPASQRLAGQTQLKITVANPGRRTIPDVAVTIAGAQGAAPAQAFGAADPQSGLADPSRPVWIVDSGPRGGETAYVSTWALGPLKTNAQKTFTWNVTPIRAGKWTVTYRVAAGLNGKAKARLAGGGDAQGSFTINVSGAPAGARVLPDGRVVSKPPSAKAVPPRSAVEP